jgi:ABC-2 type transport system ATP-binding protein
VLGVELIHGCPPEKRRVGYVAEGEILPPWARIGDLVGFERGLRDEWRPAGLDAWMQAERLTGGRKIGTLSKGVRKRLELELVLAGCPSVLLLDEPLSGLDPVSRADFLESFMGYAADRRPTVLISSHILTDLERVCDRIGVLAGGVIAHEDSMDAIKERGGRLEDVGVDLIRTRDPREVAHV